MHRFGAEGLAAREFISKQVPVVMRSWQRRFEGAILPGQFERAREHSAGKQDDGRGPCDDLRIHGRPPPSVEHPHGLRLIALCAEEAAELLACLLLIGGGASPGEALRT